MTEKELPFFFRQFIAWALQSAGIEKLPSRASEWPDYFDNTNGIGEIKRKLFYKHKRSGVMLPYKGRPNPIDPKTKIGIEAHITAVAFGTSKHQRRFWRKAIDDGLVPEWSKFGPTPSSAAERMALHARFWKVPYHWVALLNGDIIHNNQISRYTYAGNGGNRPHIQVSLEGNYPGLEKNRKKKHHDLDDFTIETSRNCLRLSFQDAKSQGADIGILTAHRQYSKNRIGDPGQKWWQEIGKPMAKELGLEIDYRFRHGTGYLICKEWDEEGIVDYYGREI